MANVAVARTKKVARAQHWKIYINKGRTKIINIFLRFNFLLHTNHNTIQKLYLDRIVGILLLGFENDCLQYNCTMYEYIVQIL